MVVLKICIISTGSPGIPPIGGGGVERVVYEHVKSLSLLGNEVTLIDTAQKEERDLITDLSFCRVIRIKHINLVKLHALPLNYLLHEFIHQISLVFFALSLFPTLIQLFSSNDFDIIHVHSRYSFIAVKISKILLKFNIPIILTCHNGSLLKSRYPLWLRIYWIPEWLALRYCDRIIALSKTSKNAIIRFIKLDINDDKIDIISNGIDLSSFKINKINYNKYFINLVCISHIVSIKGQASIIEALNIVKKQQFPNARLFLIGSIIDSDYLNKINNLINQYKLKENVVLMGELPHKNIPEVLSKMDVAIWSSGLEQAMSMTILEYLSAGKPVLAKRVPQLEEMLPADIISYYSDEQELANKIIILIKNKILRLKLGYDGRTFVQLNYDWLIIAKKLENSYQKSIYKKRLIHID